ncbi:MAG: hypothetical protein ACRYF5_13535, partial [Janthinobacterium lividum]
LLPMLLVCSLNCPLAMAQAHADLPFATTAGQTSFGATLADERLQDHRGGSELTKSEMTVTGSTAENHAEQVYTGSNVISAGSFANASGIPIVIQNSGANVLIQNATILNLQMR